jgi:hypothetical protein
MTDPNDFAVRYVAAWNEADPRARRLAVESLWSAEARYYNAATEYVGHAGLQQAVTRSHEHWAGLGYTFRVRGTAHAHHGGLHFSWDMVPAGSDEPESIGFEFVILDAQNRIAVDYQFIDS